MEKKIEIGQSVSRLPGQSLRERLNEKLDNVLCSSVIVVIAGFMYLYIECMHVYAKLKPSVGVGVFVFIATLVFAVWSFYRNRRCVLDIRQGERGERIVALALQRDLAPLGYVAFHDIQLRKDGRSFNIDHLVIGSNGIFAIETKNYSKPRKGNAKVHYDGKKVLWNGSCRKNEAEQAMATARAAKKLIDDSTGLRVFVTPVLCAVGWFATSSDLYGNPVLLCMEKTLKSVIPKVQPRIKLDQSDINKIVSALDRI